MYYVIKGNRNVFCYLCVLIAIMDDYSNVNRHNNILVVKLNESVSST